MKIAYTLFCALFFLSLQAQDAGISFEQDRSFAQLLEQAQQEDKLIFVDAYATWCGPCRMMDRSVFNQEEVGRFYNANFINLKLDVEKGEGPTLARQYRVRAMPTYIFINGDGEVVHTAMGAMTASRFLELGETALQGRAR
ncbi:MAG: thioredoxin domain-containing protein [Bacteroidota bacterium]